MPDRDSEQRRETKRLAEAAKVALDRLAGDRYVYIVIVLPAGLAGREHAPQLVTNITDSGVVHSILSWVAKHFPTYLPVLSPSASTRPKANARPH